MARRIVPGIAMVAVATGLTTFVVAEPADHNHTDHNRPKDVMHDKPAAPPPPAQSGEEASKKPMEMGDMMRGCMEHTKACSAAIDGTSAALEAGRTDEAKQQLAETKRHNAECVKMMNMVHRMHRGMTEGPSLGPGAG